MLTSLRSTNTAHTRIHTNTHTQANGLRKDRKGKLGRRQCYTATDNTYGGQAADEEEANRNERATPPRLERRIAGTRHAQASCTPSRRTHPTTDFATPKRHCNCRHTTAGERRSVELQDGAFKNGTAPGYRHHPVIRPWVFTRSIGEKRRREPRRCLQEGNAARGRRHHRPSRARQVFTPVKNPASETERGRPLR